MPVMAWDTWMEIWLINLIPVVLYLGVVYHAYQLQRRPQMAHDVHWRWSFLWIQLAIVGTLIVRLRTLIWLWAAGRAGAWAVVDPELIVAAWCIGIGLLVHVYLLDKHPIWRDPTARPGSPQEPRP